MAYLFYDAKFKINQCHSVEKAYAAQDNLKRNLRVNHLSKLLNTLELIFLGEPMTGITCINQNRTSALNSSTIKHCEVHMSCSEYDPSKL